MENKAGKASVIKEKQKTYKYVHSSDLLGDDTEITIMHQDEEYRLKVTSNDKLILIK